MNEQRMVCPKCRSTYVFSEDAGNRVRKCRTCGIELASRVDNHAENTQLNQRELEWSEKLLLSVYPEGVIT